MPETLAAPRDHVVVRPCATKLESAVVIIVTRQNFYIFWQMASIANAAPISRRFWALLDAPTRRRRARASPEYDKTTLVRACGHA